jgi:hypothetical protein
MEKRCILNCRAKAMGATPHEKLVDLDQRLGYIGKSGTALSLQVLLIIRPAKSSSRLLTDCAVSRRWPGR